MSQTRKGSAAEAVANVLIGYGIAVAAQVAIFPLFGVNLPLHDNLAIGALFTMVSLVRSYALRRLFNVLTIRGTKP
jgi:hypothetical protein